MILRISHALLCLGALAGCPDDKNSAITHPSDSGADSGTILDSETDDSAETGETAETAETATDPCAALVAHASASRVSGRIPFAADLDGSGSCGPDAIVSWRWDIGGVAYDQETVPWEGLSVGTVDATLTVTDTTGQSASDALTLEVLPDECPDALDPVVLGALADEALVEASGLIVSRRDPNVLWSHNDSGDVPRLFALGRDGSALGTWTLDVAEGDWEDLAWGTDPDTSEPLLFIGDTGNNASTRDALLVYVIDEPTVDTTAEPAEHAIDTWRTLTLRLPEALNVDAMLVDPDTGDLLLISDAEDGRSVLLRKPAPHLDGDDVTLEEVGELAFGAGVLAGDTLATGADITPLGERVVIRTRDEAWLWLRDGAESVADALTADPCPIALPAETLGEAITFDIVNGGVLTTSEGAHEPLNWVPFYEQPECIDTLYAEITATPPGGPLPLDVVLDASASCVPEGLAGASWDVDGVTLTGEYVTASWLASGSYPVTLTITDNTGNRATATTTIDVEAGDCPSADTSSTLGVTSDDELLEASGLAVSRLDPDVLWTHNDSGDSPRLFALDRFGTTLGTWTLDVDKGDFEDMAAGYSEAGVPELWVGDIGDNGMMKAEIHVYRIDEPVIPAGDAEDHTVTAVDTITLTYPDGPRNCETMMVDPVTRDLYLVTKDYDGNSEVYRKRAPHTDGETAVLEYLLPLTFGSGDLPGGKPATGGEFSADGAWIVVRTYNNTAYIWRRDRSATVDDAFATTPCPVVLPVEPQGEAICFDTDGPALLTISEGIDQPIYRTTLTR